MKNTILLFALLFSVMTIYAQKKLPEPKTDFYTIRKYFPNGDGFILSNLNFKSRVTLKQPGRNRFAWSASVYRVRGMRIEGYVYKGKTYSVDYLLREFNYNINNTSVFYKVNIVFRNGKNYSNYMGSSGAPHTFDYKNNDENTDFGLRSVSLKEDPKSMVVEGTIKRGLEVKEIKRKNEVSDKKIIDKKEGDKKSGDNKIANKKITDKAAADIKLKADLNKIEKIADKKIADKKIADKKIADKAAADIKLKADLNKIEKNTATALTGIFNGLSDGSISYVRGGIGLRTDEDSNSFSLSSPTNLTYEIGIEGFYMGFGLPDSNYDESSGFSWLVGVDYFIYEGNEGFNLDFGLNAEFGMGNLDATDYNDGKYETNYTEDAIFYSFGAQIMLGKVLYVSYNYGFYNGDSKRSYSDSKSSIDEKGSGNFTKLGFGLALSF